MGSDNRDDLGGPLPGRYGASLALALGVCSGLPVLVASPNAFRSQAELMKYAAVGSSVGVDVHTPTRRVLDMRTCTDEMDFALLLVLRELEDMRGAVLPLALSVPASMPLVGEHGGHVEPDAPALTAVTGPEQGPGQPAAPAGQAGGSVVELRRHLARYERLVDDHGGIFAGDVPPLPEQTQPWGPGRLRHRVHS